VIYTSKCGRAQVRLPDNADAWQLYAKSSKEAAADELTAALVRGLRWFEGNVKKMSPDDARFHAVYKVWWPVAETLAAHGATDSEPVRTAEFVVTQFATTLGFNLSE
jgi:hypothetical protein